MNVLHVTAWYPTPEKPNWGVFVQEHIAASNVQHDARVIHICGDHRFTAMPVAEAIAGGVRVRYWSRIPGLGQVLGCWAGLAGMRAVVQGWASVDIVHAHTIHALMPALLIGRRLAAPVVYSEHSTQFLPSDPAQFSMPERVAMKWMVRRVEAWTAVSPMLADAVRGVTAVPSERGSIVPNVVSDEFQPIVGRVEDTPTIVWIGSLSEQKDPLRFVAVLSALKALTPFTAIMIGSGELEADVARGLRHRGLDTVVRLMPPVPKAELAQLLSTASLLVCTSRYETFSVVVAEALAAGVPVVVPPCGGPEYYVHAGDGVVLPDRSIDAFVMAISSSLTRTVDRQAISTRARQRFGSSTVQAQLDGIYRRVRGGAPRCGTG